MKKLELTIESRVAIVNILPKKGSYEAMKEKKEFLKSIGFTKEEIEKHKIHVNQHGQVAWNEDKEKTTIETKEISKELENHFTEILIKLDKEKSMPDSYTELFEIFCFPIKKK